MRLRPRRRQGAVAVLVAVLLVFLITLVAFAVDIGYVLVVRTHLQAAADASALAAVRDLPDPATVRARAKEYAALNRPEGVVQDGDVECGQWNAATRTFAPNLTPYNAVRVTVRQTQATGNPVRYFFAPVIGHTRTDVTASAVAVTTPGIGGRFLLDDEMFDTDEPWVEPLKAKYPSTPVENFLTDQNKDFFIDLFNYLPAGNKQVVVRTGQVGDEGMFDITANQGTGRPQFPFGPTTNPSFTDFLKFGKGGSPAPWVYKSSVQSRLEPSLKGVGRFNVASKFAGLVNPDFVHVSPVYKSDVNSNDSVGAPATGGVSGAQDERRGLVAFKILGVQPDPRGGSYLPNLRLEIVNPSSVNLGDVQPVGTGGAPRGRLVY